MGKFLASPLRPGELGTLLKFNLGICALIFACLEIWRPYYFLTDDNLSAGWPILTEIGRQLKSRQSPFLSHYLFGGGYDLSKDIGIPFWHPLFFLPSLLADTPGRFAMMEVIALSLLLLAATGFTLLARALVEEFNPTLPAAYVLFYTASWLFTSYILIVTSSWIQFLANQGALAWLAVGILNRRLLWGTALVLVITVHEIFCCYAPSIMVSAICLSVFALGLAMVRRSPVPLFNFVFGNVLAILFTSPFLVHVLQGFALSARAGGMSLRDGNFNAVPPEIFPFSFFAGNWTGPVAAWGGFKLVSATDFPYVSMLLASAAAWCLLPALFNRARWRGIEITLLAAFTLLFVMVVRPPFLAHIMSHLIFIRSMRWPFRECLQLLFFVHVFLLIRPPGRRPTWEAATAIFSLAMFVLPLPFDRVPTFNPLARDRAEILSGHADLFWSRVKPLLQPGDNIATVIPEALWKKETNNIPYVLMGTANFPAYLRVKCISGYAPTVPKDEVPLKIPISYWFGAYDETQIPALLQARPNLKIIEVVGNHPLRLQLISRARTIDLSPLLAP